MRITAAVCRDGAAAPRLEQLDLEAPRAGEALVRIEAVGVCHTDIRAASRPGPRPIVLGHEGAGTVEAVGEAVTGLQAGDKVLMSFAFCGACGPCRRQARAYCIHNGPLSFAGTRADGSTPLSQDGEPVFASFFGQSSFATHAVCEARQMIRLDPDAPLQLYAPLGCGIQTGAGAVLNALKLRPGQSFAVFGSGSVGLAAVMAAKVAGAGPIIAIDPVPARRALALELGASLAVDPAADDPVEAVRAATGGEGAEATLNTTDIPEVYRQGLAALRPLGTFGFVTTPRSELAPDWRELMLGGRTVRGIVQGDSEPQAFIPRLIGLHRDGRFPLEKLVTIYPFDDIARAFHDSETGAAIKPVLQIS